MLSTEGSRMEKSLALSEGETALWDILCCGQKTGRPKKKRNRKDVGWLHSGALLAAEVHLKKKKIEAIKRREGT